MRVAILVRRFDPLGGGTERDMAAAAQCLHQAGHEISIYAARASGAFVAGDGRAVHADSAAFAHCGNLGFRIAGAAAGQT